MSMHTKLEVTPRTIIFAACVVVGIWFLFQVRDIIRLLFIAFIFMTALRPSVDALQSWGVPRILAIMTMYIVVIAAFSFFGTIIVPPLINESIRLSESLPHYLERALPLVNVDTNTLIAQIAPIGQNVAKVTVGVFSNLITLLTLAVLTFYFLLERNNLRQILSAFIGDEAGEQWIALVKRIEERLGAWVRGQLLLGLIIGMATYIGLTFLKIPFALPLAILAGILEMAPIIGPIISAIPTVLIALTLSPQLALAVVALYFVIQQLENNIIVPMVMMHTVGLPPVASLLALLVGGKLGGFMGILLAVPILLLVQTVVQSLIYKQQSKA